MNIRMYPSRQTDRATIDIHSRENMKRSCTNDTGGYNRMEAAPTASKTVTRVASRNQFSATEAWPSEGWQVVTNERGCIGIILFAIVNVATEESQSYIGGY